MFFKRPSGGADWLIVGLGNPGPKYEGTRHNAGYAALDAAARQWGAQITRVQFEGLTGRAELEGQRAILLKPTTYMNLSGHSAAAAAKFYKLPPERVLVLCDDIAQAPGRLRIRASGSAGGHNGLKDLIVCLGSDAFPRIRIGVGAKPTPEYDLAAWVLGRPGKAEAEAIAARLADVETAIRLIVSGKLPEAQNRCNG